MVAIALAAAAGGAQPPRDTGDRAPLPTSSGLLTLGRDGRFRAASAARIRHEAGRVDKVGSFLFGLGYGAEDYQSAALSLVGLTPRGALDPVFAASGSVVTPLLPRKNRDRATVTALLEDASGRAIVVGWRSLSSALDANFLVVVAARYTAAGVLDPSFGDGGIVTTRIGRDDVTQAFAATLDGEGRLLVAGYNGGQNRNRGRTLDDWPVRVVLLRYTAGGVLDPSFGTGGVASRVLVPGRPDERTGREFLYYDPARTKAAGVILDRQGRAVVAAARGDGPIVLLRFTREGALDAGFGSAGTVETPVGRRSGVSSLSWDAEGRLLAAGTSDGSALLLRYFVDGALDTSFGDGGIRRTPIGEAMRVSAALPGRDGHLLVVASGGTAVQLARYDRDGRLEEGFGSHGVIRVALDRSVAETAGLALDDSGTPVVAVASTHGLFFLRFPREGAVEQSLVEVPAAKP